MVVFHSVADAVNAGFEIYDRTKNGYLVRTKAVGGCAVAFVVLRK